MTLSYSPSQGVQNTVTAHFVGREQGSHSEENLLGKKKSMDSYSKISLETHILNSYNPIYTIKYLVKKNFWPKKNIGQKIFGQKNIW